MLPLVRRYIKTSFVFLALGLLLGGWITVAEFMLGIYPPPPTHYRPRSPVAGRLHVDGRDRRGDWMFPRPGRDDTSYRPGLAEAVYWVITLSTGVRAAAEFLVPWSAGPALRWIIALGGLGQLAGAALFVLNRWPRIRMPGS